MATYVIVEVEVHDPVQYEDYKKLTPPSLVPFQGKFVVRGGAAEALEGSPDPQRIVVLEFPTRELARKWWSSNEYAPAKALRQRISTTRMILVDGA
jgi:uncharacterized protein (DUF1330 family)